MRQLTIATAIVAATALPAAALADVSYTYIGAGYTALEPDGFDRLDGFNIDGSVAVHQHAHLIANFLRTKDSPFKVERTRVGAGFNFPLNSQFELIGRVGWSFAEASISGVDSKKDDGVLGQTGVRGMLTDTLELNAFLTYDDVEKKVSGDVGFVYELTPQLGATASYTHSDEMQTWNAGLRYAF